jgi:hypothetical protein|tara:strand:+ start:196 stop:585 length:390 start_codon:yes stop_codon:yes gene_type:complete
MDDNTAAKMVAAYINIRSAIQEKDEEIKKLKEQQGVISNKMLELCAKEDIDSVRTPYGTVTRRVYSSYWTSDWEQMYKFIQENEAFHLLEKRIHNTHMKEFLEENPDSLPIGLQSDRKYAVSVRKPTKK